MSCTVAACTGTCRPDSDAAAETLWLPAESVLREDAARPVRIKNGRSIYIDGSGAVVFTVSDCNLAARQITAHFAQTQWQPRSTYLTPEMRSLYKSGCQPFSIGGVMESGSNGPQHPNQPYVGWQVESENGRGDIVSYRIGGTGQQLLGYASYVPRKVVESSKRKLGAELAH
jgi:hypothetical protein